MTAILGWSLTRCDHRQRLQGETVPYIICVPRNEDGTAGEAGSGLAERAYHPEEVNGNPRLTVDVNYYLSNQVTLFDPPFLGDGAE